MPRRRPVLTNAGAVTCVLLAGLAGCAGPVEVEPTDPGRRAEACERLADALPETVAGQQRRDVETPYAGAWGDPPIVLRCGVPVPRSFDAVSSCQITNGVAWYIPDEQITGEPVDIVMTTIGREPGVEVSIPAEYFPPAEAMVDLAPAVKRATEKVERCG